MKTERKKIRPDYYDEFGCIAGQCPITCCQEWKIAVDADTNRRWKKVLPPDTMPECAKSQSDVEGRSTQRQLQPSEIDYLRKKLKSRIKTNLTYKVARSFLNKIIENKQLIIKDVIGTEHMDALTSGAVITCNHFNAFDSFAMQIAYEKSKQCKKRRLYRVIREGNYTNFPGFYGMLMRNCYTFPLSSNRDTMKKFLSSMDTVLPSTEISCWSIRSRVCGGITANRSR